MALLVLAAVVGVAAVVFALAVWYGVFMEVAFLDESIGDFTLVYLEHRGGYYGVGPVFGRVLQMLVDSGMIADVYCRAGMFFDDPSTVKAEDCRSFCGAVVEGQLSQTFEEAVRALGLQTRYLERQACKTTIFPLRNFLSFFLFPVKVYPAAQKLDLLCDGSGCCLELYEGAVQGKWVKVAVPAQSNLTWWHDDDVAATLAK